MANSILLQINLLVDLVEHESLFVLLALAIGLLIKFKRADSFIQCTNLLFKKFLAHEFLLDVKLSHGDGVKDLVLPNRLQLLLDQLETGGDAFLLERCGSAIFLDSYGYLLDSVLHV